MDRHDLGIPQNSRAAKIQRLAAWNMKHNAANSSTQSNGITKLQDFNTNQSTERESSLKAVVSHSVKPLELQDAGPSADLLQGQSAGLADSERRTRRLSKRPLARSEDSLPIRELSNLSPGQSPSSNESQPINKRPKGGGAGLNSPRDSFSPPQRTRAVPSASVTSQATRVVASSSTSPLSAIQPGASAQSQSSLRVPPRDWSEFDVPEWYTKVLPFSKVSSSQHKQALVIINKINRLSQAHRLGKGDETTMKDLGDALQQATFLKVDARLVRDGNMFAKTTGLPEVATNPGLPAYIRSDAKFLFKMWSEQCFQYDPLGGLAVSYNKNNTRKISVDTNYKGVETYKHKKGMFKEYGDNGLENGQWWPSLEAVRRDSGHGETVAGISSGVRNGEERGASSILVAMTYDDDQDNGEVIFYTGTKSSSSDDVSRHTKLLMESHDHWERGRGQRGSGRGERQRLPVRVIRSYKGREGDKSKFAPEKGYRYDGLYDVVDHKMLDYTTQHVQFKLVRQEGQDPIRYTGAAQRPNRYELDWYKMDEAQKSGSGIN